MAMKLLFLKLSTMIIICLLQGVVLMPLAELANVVDDGCGGSGDHAGDEAHVWSEACMFSDQVYLITGTAYAHIAVMVLCAESWAFKIFHTLEIYSLAAVILTFFCEEVQTFQYAK
eukprot:12980112-Ditylum_brightwellii.AAC.1